MKNAPVISVVLPVYNAERYIEAAANSILSQTYGDFELIAVDDGSTDRTAEILGNIDDSRVRIESNPANRGLIFSLNRGVALARGQFVARMDADDVSVQDRFERQINYLRENPAVGVLGGQMQFIDQQGNPCGKFKVPTSHAEIVWNLLTGNWSLAHPTILIRKEILDRYGGYNPAYPHIEDTELWLRLANKTKFANLSDEVLFYRQTPTSVCRTHGDLQRQLLLDLISQYLTRLLGRAVGRHEVAIVFETQNHAGALSEDTLAPAVKTMAAIAEALSAQSWIGDEQDREKLRDAAARSLIRACRSMGTGTEVEGMRGGRLTRFARRALRWTKPIFFPADQRGTKPTADKVPGASETPSLPSLRVEFPGLKSLGCAVADGSIPAVEQISVVVLSFERMEALASLLKGLLEQTGSGITLEVIVWNNSSRYRLRKTTISNMGRLLGQFPDLKIINSGENWMCRTRYTAASLAKFDRLLFLDDDVVLKSRNFIKGMAQAHSQLGANDILSCWNSIWTDWTGPELESVGLTFYDPAIREIIESDTSGSGICMFSKRLLGLPALWEACDRIPTTIGMGFSPLMYQGLGSRTYYFPAHGMLDFHRENVKHSLFLRENQQAILHSFYKWIIKAGYTPLLARPGAGPGTPPYELAQRSKVHKESW